MDDVAVDVGEAEVAALMAICQLLVVDAEQVQTCGMPVMNVNRVLCDTESEVIGAAVRDAFLHSATGHPDAEALFVVVTARRSLRPGAGVVFLNHGSTTKLAAPDHERVLEQSALAEIFNQPRARLIDFPSRVWQVRRKCSGDDPSPC